VINLEIKRLALAASVVLALSACQQEKPATTDEATDANKDANQMAETSAIKDEDKIGYALGAKMASFILKDTEEFKIENFNKESVSRGFNDALVGESKLSDQQIQEQFGIFQQQMQAAQQQAAVVEKQKQAEKGEQAKAAGATFLATNGQKEGVITTESGLQYSVVTEGTKGEPTPKETDVVKVHYTGSFIDGKTFDSSVERGEPTTFPLNRVIKGWTEGLQLMTVGSKYHFVIPGDLAYGPNGRPGSIPGNSVLQFDVELLAINPDANTAESSDK